jgi:hypothetical protein
MKTLNGIVVLFYLSLISVYFYANAWGIDKITNYFEKDLHWFVDLIIGAFTVGFGFVIGFVIWLLS